MGNAFLFRIDGAADNDAFFKAMQPAVAQVYAGIDLRLGSAGWAPDFVRADINEQTGLVTLTIIELEAIKPTALISCRKYLPESSTEIVSAFVDYLDRVIRQCRATADSRELVFSKFRGAVAQSKSISVVTAGALRSETNYVECRHLLDQPEKFALIDHQILLSSVRQLNFVGDVSLTAVEVNTVTRCILILDAVIRKADHSNATLHTWRGQSKSQPLKVFLKKSKERYPAIRSLILTKGYTRGMRIDFGAILPELGDVWHDRGDAALTAEAVGQLIKDFYPIAAEIGGNDRMSTVFEKCRKFLSNKTL